MIEQGDSVRDAAREWNVTPRSIAEWRHRYQDLLGDDSGVPMMEPGELPADAQLTYIPQAAREIFLENWERLVTETAATEADFRQSPREIFLQTSPLTAWLFQDGKLDRGILAGAISGLFVLAIVISFLLADRTPPVPETVSLPEPPPRDDIVIDVAAVAAESFFKAANWQERLKFIREPEAVRGMVEAYYKENPDGPVNDAALSLASTSRHLVNLSYDVPSQGRSHFLCVVLVKGKPLVDWESSSLYQEAQIAKLRANRSTGPTRVAVSISRDPEKDYYNYAFSDAGQWVCYQLNYPGLKLNLYGYARRDSPEAIIIDSMLGIVDSHAAVIEVRFPPQAATDNQVEILGVVRNEWVPEDR